MCDKFPGSAAPEPGNLSQTLPPTVFKGVGAVAALRCGAAALRLLPGTRRKREARARWRWALVQGRVLGWRALARAAGRKDSTVELQRIRDFGSPNRTWIREGFVSPWK